MERAKEFLNGRWFELRFYKKAVIVLISSLKGHTHLIALSRAIDRLASAVGHQSAVKYQTFLI